MKTGQQPYNWSVRTAREDQRCRGFVIVMIPSMTVAGPVRSGEQIYRQQCASCHGAKGEGTDDHYPRPLVGERSVAALARLIAKTMPEDAPGDCVGEDAESRGLYL